MPGDQIPSEMRSSRPAVRPLQARQLVHEMSEVGEARRKAMALAASVGMDSSLSGKLAIIITEMATNLVKHTRRGGEIIVREMKPSSGSGVECLALDSGPGMRNVAESLRDGHSTAGSAGTGLGAILRLSTDFDIYSLPDSGTAVLSRLHGPNEAPTPLNVGAINLELRGESACGDAWALDGRKVMIADGLGHGPDAAEASNRAVEILHKYAGSGVSPILEAAHGALRATRGAAVAVADLDRDQGVVQYAGVGNISGVIVSPSGQQHLVSVNGTAGHTMRKLVDYHYPWSPKSTLIMHSDGLGTKWRIEPYPGLLTRDPAIIAGVLYRDFARERDDVTVVVVQERER